MFNSNFLISLGLLQDRLDHLVADARGFGEPRRKVGLDFLEFLAVAIHVAEADAGAPVLKAGLALGIG